MLQIIQMGKAKVLEENPVLMSICSPQIPYELDRDGSWASAIRGQQIDLLGRAES
jgi:hypothetical protein